MRDLQTPPVKASAETEVQQFELLFHIGAGKTGTSSIQETLRTQRQKLESQGIYYLGLMLEHAPVRRFGWQKASGSQDFLALPENQATMQVVDVLRTSIPKIVAAGCRRAIWSNEWFFGHGGTALRDAMHLLASEGVRVKIVVYVRRHDSWARSAYVQWGLKHKTYDGALIPFSKWIKQRRLGFAKTINQWIELFGTDVMVRNLDAAGDAVGDFMDVVGIASEGIEKLRTNETPPPEELALRSLFNEQFKGKVPVRQFDRVLGASIFERPSINQWLNDMMPSEQDLRSVADDCADDRKSINEILSRTNQAPIDVSPLPTKAIRIDSERLLGAVCQAVIHQAIRIDDLEKSMAKALKAAYTEVPNARGGIVDEPASSECSPVFVISTGRSGSTLVQRLLNCHDDLVIWGEHYGFLNGIANAYAQMGNPDQRQYPRVPSENRGPSQLLPTLRDPSAPLEWANPWSFEEFRDQLKSLINKYFGGRVEAGKRWGFKEILYNRPSTLRMLSELYPSGKFIFVKRDPLEVTRSKVFAFIKEERWTSLSLSEQRSQIQGMLRDVYDHYRVYDTFLHQQPGRGILVNYEDLVCNSRDAIQRMLDHLELPADRFDWGLGEQVMGAVITTTRRDDAIVELIHEVAESIRS